MLQKTDLVKNSKFLKDLYFASLSKKKRLLEGAKISELRTLVKVFSAVFLKQLPLTLENRDKLKSRKKSKIFERIFEDPEKEGKLLKLTAFKLKSKFISHAGLISIVLSALYEK